MANSNHIPQQQQQQQQSYPIQNGMNMYPQGSYRSMNSMSNASQYQSSYNNPQLTYNNY